MTDHANVGTDGGPERIGRYTLFAQIGAGGMARIHLGRLAGALGFARHVAIKRVLPCFASDPEFTAMLIDEARLAARIQHPNVVSVLDAVATDGEVFLVMEYVHGESLAQLLKAANARGARVDPAIAVAVLNGVLRGLHAAHESTNERGEPMNVVHPDVTPQNVLVGTDGSARVLDFGIARALGRVQLTRMGELKGKLSYMAPEQLLHKPSDRRVDIFAASVVLWETLTGRRLFEGDSDATTYASVLHQQIEDPGSFVPDLPPQLRAATLRGLDRDPLRRFTSALEMAEALEDCLEPASPSEVSAWVRGLAKESLDCRAAIVAQIDRYVEDSVPHDNSVGPPVHSRPGRVVVVAAIACALIIAAATGLHLARRRPPTSDAATEAATPPASSSAVTASESPAASAASLVESHLSPTHTSTTSGGGRRPRPNPRGDPSSSPRCVRSWTDDAGIKRYNPDCPP